MENYTNQIEIIKKLMDIGITNRNEILMKIIQDYNILKVFVSYRDKIKDLEALKGESVEIAICEETGLKSEDVIKSINYINRLSQMIDSEKTLRAQEKHKDKISRQEPEKNLFNYGIEGESKSTYIKKKQEYRTQLDKFYKKYYEAKRKGTLRVSYIKENIHKIEKKIRYLDNPTIDMLTLAEIYTDIGDYRQSYLLLNDYTYNDLSLPEKQKYIHVKTETLRARNTDYIKKLYSKGMSYPEIRDACERQPSEFRAGIIAEGIETAYDACLSIRFIRKIYDDLTKQEKENDENER